MLPDDTFDTLETPNASLICIFRTSADRTATSEQYTGLKKVWPTLCTGALKMKLSRVFLAAPVEIIHVTLFCSPLFLVVKTLYTHPFSSPPEAS